VWQLLFALALLGCGDWRQPARQRPTPTPDERRRAEQAFDRYRRPDLLLAALELKRGERVADLGAGRGYLSVRLAAAVGPTGLVVATDIDATALAALRTQAPGAKAAGTARIEARQVTADDPGLAQERYDLILMCEMDHLLAHRVDYLARLRSHLLPSGRLAVCNRRADRQALLYAATAAGFALRKEEQHLPAHFLFIFGVDS
jgi:cyclopropane fatty-acyl-phospholipid synthase-like methyltransferase